MIRSLWVAVALVALCALWPALSRAQGFKCAPFEDSANWSGAVLAYSLTDPDGPYLLWTCYPRGSSPPGLRRQCMAAPWSVIDLRRLGDRADTVRLATDPIAAFHASVKRHVTEWGSARCAALLAQYPKP